MKRSLIHIVLYIGCIALLVAQSFRIQKLQAAVARSQSDIPGLKFWYESQLRELGSYYSQCTKALATCEPAKK